MIRSDRQHLDAMRAHYRRTVALAKPNARTATIARLIEAHVARTGLAPTDAELASACAISVERVRRHLALLGR